MLLRGFYHQSNERSDMTLQTNMKVYNREMKILLRVQKTIRGEENGVRMRNVHFGPGGYSEDR